MNTTTFLYSRWLRGLAWALGGLVLLWVLAWAVVPPLVKSQMEAQGSAALGRKLTLGGVDFKPWTLELTLTDLAIATADGKASQFTVARVYVDAALESIWRLAPVLGAVVVQDLVLQITRTSAGQYDIDDIISRLSEPSPTPASAPVRFALYNLELRGGAVDFTDAPVAKQHSLQKLHLTVPFLSNLDAKRDVLVEPRLAFELNGSAFDSAAAGTPFAQTRKGDANFKITRLDVAPYLAYLPASLPVQLKGAVMDADVRLDFVQTPQVALTVTGSVNVSDLKVADAHGADLLAVASIQAVLADVRPLEQVAKLASLDITAPRLWAARSRAGALNLDFPKTNTQATPVPVATKIIATTAGSTGATATNDDKSAVAKAWSLELTRFALHKGAVNWADDSTQPQAVLNVTDLELQADAVRWPFANKPAQFSGSVALASPVARGKPASLRFAGQGTDQQGQVHAVLNGVALASAAPYVARFLNPKLSGVLDTELDAQWQAGNLQVSAVHLALRDVALQGDKPTASTGTGDGQSSQASSSPSTSVSAWPKFKTLEVMDAHIDLNQQSVRVGKVALHSPTVSVQRGEDGRWMFAQWLKEPPPSTGKAPASKAWRVAVGELGIDDGTVAYADSSLAKRVRLGVAGLNLQMKNLSLDGKKPMPLTVSARVKAGRTEPGTLAYKGTVMWDPVLVQGSLDAQDLPAHALAPYFADQLTLEVLRADTSFKGQVRYASGPAGARVDVKGDAALEDFRANSVAEELLSWKALNVPGIQLTMAPGAATRLEVREAALTDFYARVAISEAGRLNLQDLVKKDAASASTSTSSPPAQAVPASPDAIIQIGPISLVNGRVLFSDHFIKPNYSADLSELTGKLSQFSSVANGGAVQLADLDVRGRAEGSATLEITGKVNPLAKPLALNIHGKVRDLELPPLSPYAIKYAGYGIARGKLSVDVNYAVTPDGQLTATNNIVLNQLMFGNKVEGAPNSLPVKLAVALLADSDGVIDLNLPISGSLNDPQFSLGAVVFKVITNVIVKAVTAPFSLLASAFGGGGGDDLSMVTFAPGSSALTPDAQAGLDKVAGALVARPGLKMTVTGTAALEVEREAIKRERLNTLLLAEKRRSTVSAGQDGAQVGAVVGADEYPVLLKSVYRRADITKPRNLVGMTKDISVADMEALLLTNMAVNEEAIRDLALQRGVAVKDYLAHKQLPAERLFLGAAKAVTPDAQWKPQAELSLTTR